jgi:hypothetical protein
MERNHLLDLDIDERIRFKIDLGKGCDHVACSKLRIMFCDGKYGATAMYVVH